MKKVIVTGASGFIGKALVKRLLSEGYQVCVVVRDSNKMNDIKNDNLRIVQTALNEYRNLKEQIHDDSYDVFFHLAWDGTYGESFGDYHRQLNNAAYAVDALMSAIDLSCQRFVLIGTVVQLETKHYAVVDDCEPRISCIYGAAKDAAEMVCKTLAFQNKIAFNTAILASVYGEGDQSNMIQNVLIRALLKGESPKLVSGNNLYDWIYVDDVVSALIDIAEKGAENRTYYVGHRELQTFQELVRQTRNIIAPNVELIFGESKDKSVIDYSLVDREALFRDTGFECKADFKKSILKTAQWLREQEMLGAGK